MRSWSAAERRLRISYRKRARRGVSSVDYVLVLGVILPMVAFLLTVGRQIVRLVYEMVCVLVSWPLM